VDIETFDIQADKIKLNQVCRRRRCEFQHSFLNWIMTIKKSVIL